MAGGETANLYATIGADVSGFVKGVKQADAELKGFSKEASSASTVLEGFMKSGLSKLAAGFSVAAIASAGVELTKIGAEAERLEVSFDGLAAKSGESGGAMLAAMRKAANGTISDTKLMLAANRAMMLGVADTADEMAGVLAAARERGKAMGLSSEQAFSDLVTGIGRMSPMILDNLGITIDAEKTFKEYAETVGKSADKLSDAEKKQALLNSVLADMQGVIPTEDDLDKIERLGATWENLKIELGKELAPDAVAGVQQLTDAFGWLTGAVDDYERFRERLHMDWFATGAEEATAQIALLRDRIAETGDPTGSLAAQVAELEARVNRLNTQTTLARLYIQGLNVSEEDARKAAGGFGGALAAATPAVTNIGDEADIAAGKVLGLVASMATFATGAYGKPATLSDLTDYFTEGVKAGKEADIQHRLATLKNIAETADIMQKHNQTASKQFASDWESAADRAQKAIEDSFKATADAVAAFVDEAAGASKNLFDMSGVEGFGGGMAPGQNGPFENLFRVTDIAAHGGDSPWAAALGMDQEAARKIAADFQAGLMSPDVIGLIDSNALIEEVRRQQEAERSQRAYAESIAAQAGVDVVAVMEALGIDPGGTAAEKLAEGLHNGLIAANPGADILATINADITNRKEEFAVAGGAAANMLLSGMLTNSDKGILNSFAMALVPMILSAIRDKDRRTGVGS